MCEMIYKVLMQCRTNSAGLASVRLSDKYWLHNWTMLWEHVLARENDSKRLLNITRRKAKLTSMPGKLWLRNVHFGAVAYTRQRPNLRQTVYFTRRRNGWGERIGICLNVFTSAFHLTPPAHTATRSADQESGSWVTSKCCVARNMLSLIINFETLTNYLLMTFKALLPDVVLCCVVLCCVVLCCVVLCCVVLCCVVLCCVVLCCLHMLSTILYNPKCRSMKNTPWLLRKLLWQ